MSIDPYRVEADMPKPPKTTAMDVVKMLIYPFKVVLNWFLELDFKIRWRVFVVIVLTLGSIFIPAIILGIPSIYCFITGNLPYGIFGYLIAIDLMVATSYIVTAVIIISCSDEYKIVTNNYINSK